MYGYGCFGGFRGFMMFPFGWLGIGLIVLGIILYLRTDRKERKTGLDALAQLDMKFANGEIDEETYLKKKKILSGK